MDFTLPYSEEQQKFRKEVRTWLDENIPAAMREPIDSRDFTEEQYKWWRGTHKKLAAKGWLYPTFPKEYGGGGLDADHDTILQEEYLRIGGMRAPNAVLITSTLLVWATEAQKQKFLVPMLKGEISSFQKFTEPQSGADLANYQTKAVRDGDDWVITGQNVFVSGRSSPDFLWGPAVTDSSAPRHRNLGFFMIANPSPGLEIRNQNLVNGAEQHFIFLDGVRVPGDHLIGGDHQGWQVANTTLELEHGGGGTAFPRDVVVDDMMEYARTTKRDGSTVGKDPVVQQAAAQAYLESHINGLFAKRTYWMYQAHKEIVYEGNESSVWGRESSLRITSRVRDIYGMYAMLGTRDPRAPHGGEQEVFQRSRAGQNHAGGSTQIAKVVLARRIGISRTKERPAPTPSTAVKSAS